MRIVTSSEEIAILDLESKEWELMDHTECRVLALQLSHSEQMNPDGVP